MRNAISIPLVLAGLACALAPHAGHAESFWCGNRLVREGMAAAEVVSRCGEPASIRVVEEPVYARRSGSGRLKTGVVVTEYWVYDRGYGKFPAQIVVREGIAEQVELLRR